jgi:hypothetical protein
MATQVRKASSIMKAATRKIWNLQELRHRALALSSRATGMIYWPFSMFGTRKRCSVLELCASSTLGSREKR